MAATYTINDSSNGNSQIDALSFGLSKNVSYNISSSNQIQQTVNVSASGWTQLSTGSLTDVVLVKIWNDTTTYSASVIQIATGSAGQNTLTTLNPGTTPTTIWWSGSLGGLYAKVLSAAPNVNGVLQYWLAQS